MARKQRNDVDYFPHSVTHGKKMFFIRQKYKNDGYTIWFMLLEHLGRANYHYLDLKDDVELMYLSAEFMVDVDLLKEVINDLVMLGEFDKDLWQNEQILFNEKFVGSIEDAYKKRSNECVDKKALLLHLCALGRLNQPLGESLPPKSNLKGSGNPQTKLNYSKVKNTKEIYSDDSIEISLVNLMVKNITELNQEFKKPNLLSWAKDFDLMIRIDKRKPEDIRSMLQWVKTNPFWSKNILSPAKLRKQYDRLKMETGNGARKTTDFQNKYTGIGN